MCVRARTHTYLIEHDEDIVRISDGVLLDFPGLGLLLLHPRRDAHTRVQPPFFRHLRERERERGREGGEGGREGERERGVWGGELHVYTHKHTQTRVQAPFIRHLALR